jgi:hypothetical protein
MKIYKPQLSRAELERKLNHARSVAEQYRNLAKRYDATSVDAAERAGHRFMSQMATHFEAEAKALESELKHDRAG